MTAAKANAPVEFDKEVLMAVQAVSKGIANGPQQILALDWIVTRAAGALQIAWRDESEGGERASSFLAGRQFVGMQIAKLLQSETARQFDEPVGKRPANEAKNDD